MPKRIQPPVYHRVDRAIFEISNRRSEIFSSAIRPLAGAGAVLILLRLLFTWGAPRRFGLFLAMVAAAAAAWGAYQNFQDNS